MTSVLPYLVLAAALALAGVRIVRRRRRSTPRAGTRPTFEIPLHSDVALVAVREVRERTRGRVFRVGTIIILLAVAAAVVIPTLHHSGSSTERVGVLGPVSAPLRSSILAPGPELGTTVSVTAEPDLRTAEHDLTTGHVDVVLDGTTRVLVNTTPSATDTSMTSQLAQALAFTISLQTNVQASGLSPQQAEPLIHPTPIPITGLHPAHRAESGQTVTVYGLILIFLLLSQYGTWILLGVVEEKSSRVVEVLLATLRPRQLLAGKVVGIGIVALIQAALILAVALGLGAAVGSDLLHGGNPTNVFATLVWLVLGYVFYCWVYAAAGSLATRQEHIQTLAFPLQLPRQTTLGVSNVSFGLNPAARVVLNSVFLHECRQGRSRLRDRARGQDPADGADPRRAAPGRARPGLRPAAGPTGYDPLQRFLELFEGVNAADARADRAAELAALPLGERLQRRIIDGERNGLDADLDEALDTGRAGARHHQRRPAGGHEDGRRAVRLRRDAAAVRAAVGRGDEDRGRLPRAAHGEDRRRGGKGTIVLATVKGDVHDIGKNLVDIILSNNGYNVVNLGIKQPVSAILEAAEEHDADVIGMSGLLVKCTVVMRENLEELNSRGHRDRVPGVPRRRRADPGVRRAGPGARSSPARSAMPATPSRACG